MNVYCRICGAPGAACGDSHQTLPLLTGEAYYRGVSTVTDKPREELQEYHYYVSGMEMTALMTEKMAQRVGAKPIDEPLDPPDNFENNEANRLSSPGQQQASDAGVTHKARQPRKSTSTE
jgi:hypothetical protein